MSDPYLFSSHRLDVLYQTLLQVLFKEGDSPFLRRVIVVPSQAIKSWLFMRMASDENLGIAAGVDVLYLSHMLRKMDEQNYARSLSVLDRSRVSSHELALFIELSIREAFDGRLDLSSKQQVIWNSLWEHLKIDALGRWSRRSEKRLLELSSRLSQLFTEYSLYGDDLIKSWGEDAALGWQEQLYLKAFCSKAPYLSTGEELRNTYGVGIQNMEIHVFGSGVVSELQHRFFCGLAQQVPLYYYLLSPCQHFWTDYKSESERRGMRKFLKIQGSSEDEQEQLDEYMQDAHPLLANMGRMGRESFAMLEESELNNMGNYPLPKAISNYQQYQDYLFAEMNFDASKPSFTMLDALKADMVLLRKPERGEEIVFSPCDTSIQVHQAKSRLRELQIVYNQIMAIIADHKDDEKPICPSDILIMMPEPKEYESSIRTVFGDERSKLPFQMLDVPFVRRSLLWKGFTQLFDLSSARWDASSLLQLFEFPAFQRRHGINMDDVESLRAWIEDTGIRWGFDQKQRDEFLKRDHCTQSMVDQSGRATWAKGIERLLLGLSMMCQGKEQEVFEEMGILPSQQIEFLHADFLSRLLELMESLKQDLSVISDGTQMTLEKWGAYFQSLLEAYFFPEIDDEDDDYGILFQQMSLLGNVHENLRGKLFGFNSAFKNLEALLGKESMGGFDGLQNTVRFASLIAMRTLPYRVVILMGMQEGKFPRPREYNAVNLLQGIKAESYIPQASDEDRYMFLESIFAAEDYLILSYHASIADDPKDVEPSIAVTELLSYLDRAYAYEGGEKASDICHVIHPYLPFDRQYFDRAHPYLRSYIPEHEAVCRVMDLGLHKQKPFLARLFEGGSLLEKEVSNSPTITVDLKDLVQSLRDPLKFYCQKTFGIYLREDKAVKNEEDFTLSALDCAMMRRRLLRRSTFDLMEIEEAKGRLPLAVFGDLAWNRVHDEVNLWRENLKHLGVYADDIIDIELSLHCKKAERISESCLQLPALELELDAMSRVKIVGSIQHLVPRGLIAFGKGTLDDTVKHWAQYLVLSELNREGTFLSEQMILWVQTGKIFKNQDIDALSALRELMRYHLKSLAQASPLMPMLVEPIWKSNGSQLRDKMRLQEGSPWANYSHDYLDWIRHGEEGVFSQTLLEDWRDHYRGMFDPMLEAWFPKIQHHAGVKS